MNLLTSLSTLMLLATPPSTVEAEIDPVKFQIEIYPYGGYYGYPPCRRGYPYWNGYCHPYGSGYYFYYGPGYYNHHYRKRYHRHHYRRHKHHSNKRGGKGTNAEVRR